jgi:hypothetical protein
MDKIYSLFKNIKSKLQKPAKTKLTKSRLDRGGGGIFTKRRKRNDVVLLPFECYQNYFDFDSEKLKIYKDGYFILCSPLEYDTHKEKLLKLPVIIYYRSHEEIIEYPFSKEKITKRDRNGNIIGNIVVDIMDLNKHNERVDYRGVKLIGQNAYDYANKNELDFVEFSLLYQMLKMKDFDFFADKKILELKAKFIHEFEKTDLFLKNPKLIEYTSPFTICPIIRKELSFNDILNGTIEGDLGRNKNNRTTTKINLHHLERLMNGKLNHNHKNVFLGSSDGNTLDSVLNKYTINERKEILKKMLEFL